MSRKVINMVIGGTNNEPTEIFYLNLSNISDIGDKIDYLMEFTSTYKVRFEIKQNGEIIQVLRRIMPSFVLGVTVGSIGDSFDFSTIEDVAFYNISQMVSGEIVTAKQSIIDIIGEEVFYNSLITEEEFYSNLSE